MKNREKLVGIAIGTVFSFSLLYYTLNNLFTAPTVELYAIKTATLDNQPFTLSSVEDKNLIVNFWATWCRPCIKEMPDLAVLNETLDSAHWKIVLISDDDAEKISAFQKKHAYELLFVKSQNELSEHGIKGYPTTYVLDKDQRVRYRRMGELSLFRREFDQVVEELNAAIQ